MKTTPRLSSRHRLLGFTLVELLVCALIISVVATVAAVSYSGYASTSRDSARTQDIKTIYDLMTVYRTQNLKNVTPWAPVAQLKIGSSLAGKQWEVSPDVIELIDAQGGVHDPSDSSIHYTYIVNRPSQLAQLLAYLENNPLGEETTGPYADASSSSFYSTRYPYVSGDDVGVLLDQNKTPIQQLWNTDVDLSAYNSTLVALFTNMHESGSISGTGGQLALSTQFKNGQLGSTNAYIASSVPTSTGFTCSGYATGSNDHIFTISPPLVLSLTTQTATGRYSLISPIPHGAITYTQEFRCWFLDITNNTTTISLVGNETFSWSCEQSYAFDQDSKTCKSLLPILASSCSGTAIGSLGHVFALDTPLSVSADNLIATGVYSTGFTTDHGSGTYSQQFQCSLGSSGVTLSSVGNEIANLSCESSAYAPDENKTQCICANGYAAVGESCIPVPIITRVDITCGSNNKFDIDIIAHLPDWLSGDSLRYQFESLSGTTSSFTNVVIKPWSSYIVHYVNVQDNSILTSSSTGGIEKPSCH